MEGSAAEFQAITEDGRWRSYSAALMNEPEIDAAISESFSTYWIVAGHRIRAQFESDAALVQFLRFMLPPYTGPGLTLYRGENMARYEKGYIGLAWTAEIETARMFGRGLNSVEGGGVVLSARCPEESILCGPNAHSNYLGERQYTVDPRLCESFKLVERHREIYT